jgi:YHS domain-containing protein
MLLSSISLVVALMGQDVPPTACPIMGEPATAKVSRVVYNGVEVGFCCAGCDVTFKKDPAKALKKASGNKLTVGTFLFDPISKNRIEPKKGMSYSDYAGVRFYFESGANKAAFDKDPKSHWTWTERESVNCPVMSGNAVTAVKAAGYLDHKGVRYYICCEGCAKPLKADPAKFAAAAKVAVPKAVSVN